MSATDKQGRPYARLSDLKQGDTVHVDGDFTCVDPWSNRIVRSDDHGLYIHCAEGHHYLDGQLNRRGYLAGIYKQDAEGGER